MLTGHQPYCPGSSNRSGRTGARLFNGEPIHRLVCTLANCPQALLNVSAKNIDFIFLKKEGKRKRKSKQIPHWVTEKILSAHVLKTQKQSEALYQPRRIMNNAQLNTSNPAIRRILTEIKKLVRSRHRFPSPPPFLPRVLCCVTPLCICSLLMRVLFWHC